MTTEADIQASVALALGSRSDVRLFRNNVGSAWQGVDVTPPELRGTHVLLKTPRRIKFGLQVGSSDLIGWQSVTVAKSMVGRRLAVFAGFEVKTRVGQPDTDQIRFLEVMRNAGAVGGVVRSVTDAEGFLLVE